MSEEAEEGKTRPRDPSFYVNFTVLSEIAGGSSVAWWSVLKYIEDLVPLTFTRLGLCLGFDKIVEFFGNREVVLTFWNLDPHAFLFVPTLPQGHSATIISPMPRRRNEC